MSALVPSNTANVLVTEEQQKTGEIKMKNAWERGQQLADKHESAGGIYVKLAGDGDKVVGAFVGDPYPREVHWDEGYKECTGEGCEYCEDGKRPSLRASINFFVAEDKEMKIIEGGVTWFKDVIKVREKYGLDKWLFEVERQGEKGNQKTTYTILPEEKISDELKDRISKTDLHDIKAIIAGSGDKETSDSAATIDSRTASAFVAKLKALPEKEVDIFLSEFGVKQIKNIKQSDEQSAAKFIQKLELKYAQPENNSEEVDPFG